MRSSLRDRSCSDIRGILSRKYCEVVYSNLLMRFLLKISLSMSSRGNSTYYLRDIMSSLRSISSDSDNLGCEMKSKISLTLATHFDLAISRVRSTTDPIKVFTLSF